MTENGRACDSCAGYVRVVEWLRIEMELFSYYVSAAKKGQKVPEHLSYISHLYIIMHWNTTDT